MNCGNEKKYQPLEKGVEKKMPKERKISFCYNSSGISLLTISSKWFCREVPN
jgi:hypothetical protein